MTLHTPTPCPDTSRWQDMQRLSGRAASYRQWVWQMEEDRRSARDAEEHRVATARVERAMAEAQDASEIGGHEDRNVPSLADVRVSAAIFGVVVIAGWLVHVALKSVGWL